MPILILIASIIDTYGYYLCVLAIVHHHTAIQTIYMIEDNFQRPSNAYMSPGTPLNMLWCRYSFMNFNFRKVSPTSSLDLAYSPVM